MPLVTHVGGGTNADYSGLEGVALLQIESGGFTSRRAVWWLIFAGVFERHPDFKLVITETPGNWFPSTAAELDAVQAFYDAKRDEPLNKALLEQVPRRPSEYMANNVFFGASFASPYEVEQAVRHGLDSQLLWGSDYPHLEGTFVYPEGRDMPSVTRLALRNTFCGIPAAETRRMVGDNAIDVYDLDADALRTIASEIGAPTARRTRHADRRRPRRRQPHRLPLRGRRLELSGQQDAGQPFSSAQLMREMLDGGRCRKRTSATPRSSATTLGGSAFPRDDQAQGG